MLTMGVFAEGRASKTSAAQPPQSMAMMPSLGHAPKCAGRAARFSGTDVGHEQANALLLSLLLHFGNDQGDECLVGRIAPQRHHPVRPVAKARAVWLGR